MITRAQIRRQLRKNGGIMNAVPRQGYFLGKLVRGVKKAVGKVGDIAGQVVKSPVGKAALLGLGAYYGGPSIMKGLGSIGPKIGQGLGAMKSGLFGSIAPNLRAAGMPSFLGETGFTSAPGILGKLGLTGGAGAMGLTGKGMLAGGAGLLTYFMSKGKTEEEAKELIQDVKRGEGLGLDIIQADMKKYRSGALSASQAYDKGYRFLTPRNYMQAATGGRVGYQDGTPAVDPRMQLSQAENIQRNNLQREMNERARRRGGSNLSELGGLELRDRFVNQTGPSGQQMYGINARPYNMNTPTTPINEANIYGSYRNQGLSPSQIKAISYYDTLQNKYGDEGMMGVSVAPPMFHQGQSVAMPMSGGLSSFTGVAPGTSPLSSQKIFKTPAEMFAQYQEGLRRSMLMNPRSGIYFDADETYDAGDYISPKGIYTFRDPEPEVTRGMIIDGKEYFSEQEAIDDMGVDRYTQVMAKGGRVGLKKGSPHGKTDKEVLEELYPTLFSDTTTSIEGSPKKKKNYKKKAQGGRIGFADGNGGTHPLAPELEALTLKSLRQQLSPQEVKRMDYLIDATGSLDEYKAEGGRIGKYGGGIGAAMPRIPTGMPRVNAGGISELDYRQEGGFVPVGVKEKADDVPAMLSKNEFVMTADAVKGAGGGNVEKGAQKMYNTMKQLEGRIA